MTKSKQNFIDKMFTIRLFALATLLFLCSLSFAQQMTMGSRTSHFKLGINFGGAWQQSDVRSKLGGGLGATLELAIIENEYSVFGMTLRGRYLYADTYGKDLKKSTGIANNPALRGDYNPQVNYLSQGNVYQNFQSRINQLDMELLITLNRLRRHGILLYGFGGAGFTGYKVNIDQLDANGNMYDYSQITGTSQSSVNSQLDALRDNTYESHAENKGRADWSFAPSYGAGFGIYLGPYVVWGIEHKVTHPITDLLDGQQWNNDNVRTPRNDVYHYSTMFFRFDLFGGRGRSRSTSSTRTDFTNVDPVVLKPEIYVNSPTQNPYVGCNANIQLTIKNIDNKSNITVRQDGAMVDPSAYDFNTLSGLFTYRTTLANSSTFAISASNSAGEKTVYVSFTCSSSTDFTPVQPAPVIRVTMPSTSPYNSSDCNQSIMATIENIQSKNNLEVRKDGAIVSSSLYDYNSVSKIFSMNTFLNGSSTFTIRATNNYGSDSRTITLSCSAPTPRVLKPIIIVSKPASNPYTSTDCNADIFATIHNIESKNNIEVRQNGVTISSILYSYDPNTKRFTLNTPIREVTVFTLLASNSGGTESATITIRCAPVQNQVPATPKPVITVVRPTTNPYISADCKSSINAVIINIDGKQNIEVRKDGQIISSSLYSYDVTSKSFYLNTDIKEITTFTITAVNSAGQESANITVKCEPKQTTPVIPRPAITVIKPVNEPHISTDCKSGISAVVVNVDGKQNIEVRENGQIISSSLYTYDVTSKILSINRDIKEITTYTITAANASGKETVNLTIKCEPKQDQKPVLPKPVISVITPVDNPHVSNDCKSSISAAILNVDGKQNLEVRQNGTIISGSLYSYDANTKIFTLNTDVKEITTYTITAANASGKESTTLTIKCEPKVEEKPALPKPLITVTNPIDNPHIAPDCKASLKAVILYVDGKQNLEVRQNGQIISSSLYAFDATTKTLTLNTDIKEITSYTITASNASGKESAVVTIKCEPKQEEKPVVPKPVIAIVTPSDNPHVAQDCKAALKATIQNIDGKQNIEVRQNGQIISSALYTYDAATKTLTLNADIKEITTYTITAVNATAKESAVVTIKCEPKQEEQPVTPKPVITINTPATNPYVSEDCKVAIKATINHIEGKQNIEVRQNGQIINSSLYSFDATSKTLTLNSDIKELTTYTITAANASGKEAAVVTIKCEPKVEPVVPKPVITVSSPVVNPYISEDCKASITARIENIEGKNAIEVRLNGTAIAADQYTYTLSDKTFKLNGDVKDVSAYTIIASNTAGKESAVVNFKCEPKVQQPEPTVDNCNCNSIPAVASPEYYSGCKINESAGTITVNSGDKILIAPGQTFSGNLTLNGGTLIIGGNATIENVNYNSGDVVVLGAASFKNINANSSTSHIKIYGSASFSNVTFNGSFENFGTSNVTQDFNINPSATFTNTGTLNISGSLNNNNKATNSGIINVSVDLKNNGSGSFINNCRLAISSQLINNSTFTNSGSISVSSATVLNSGKFMMIAGSRVQTGNLTVNAPILGDLIHCSSIKVNNKTLMNSGGIITGKVEICDENGIEQNPSAIKSACLCLASPCGNISLPNPKLPEYKAPVEEEKVTICHYPPGNTSNPQTLSIPKSALKAHLDHGDVIGTCEEVEKKKKEEAEQNEKVTICHYPPGNTSNPQTLSVPKSALKAHLDHGDVIGTCEEIEKKKKEAEDKEEKVTICHMPPGNPGNAHTLTVPKSALKAHLDHGDVIGTCEELELKKKKEAEERIRKENEEKLRKEKEELERTKKEQEEKNKRTEEERLKKEAEDKEEKVTICHMPPGNQGNAHTLTIPKSALKAHLDHGDVIGSCDEIELKKKKEAEEERLRKENEDKLKKEAEDKINREKKEAEDKVNKEREELDRIKKEQEDKLKKDLEDKTKREDEERLKKEAEDKEEKVTICHMPPGNQGNAHTLTVPKSALKAHLDHGDVLGTCDEIELKKKKEAEEKLKKEEEERFRKENEEKLRKEAEEKINREKKEAEDKINKEKEELERIKKEQEEKLKKDLEDKTKREEEERLKKDAEEKAKKEEQDRLNREAAENAKREEQDRLNREAAEKAKREEQDRLNRETAEKAKREEQDRLNREAAENARREEQDRLNREAAEKAQKEEQERVQKEAAEKARREEMERQQREAAEKARKEEQERLNREAAEKAKKEEVERKAREEAEKAKQEEERQKHEAEERQKQNENKKDGE